MQARNMPSWLDGLLDASILFSFDRTGFRRRAESFRPADLEVDLHGRRFLITGANAGLGRAAALSLARLGADLIIVCRDAERGGEAAESLRKHSGHGGVQLEVADLSDLASVRALVERLRIGRLDGLIHNAGLLPERRQLSPDGEEVCFATHVTGPFLLTRALEPRLRASSDARVVFVSSGGMYTQRLSLRDLDWSERPYDGSVAYAQTKRMQVVLAELFAERLREAGICVNAMHPGWADTGGVERSLPRFHRVMRPLLRSAEQGADTIVWLAASPAAAGETGRFWLDRAPRSTHLLPGTVETDAARRELWRLCEEKTREVEGP